MIRYSAIILLLICTFPTDLLAYEQKYPKGCEPSFIAHFNKSITVDRPSGMHLKNRGGRIIPDGVSGGALRLNNDEYIEIDSEIFDSPEGTVLFWVRPHWDYDITASHTFLSHMWADKRKGYFVLSDGWWESGGGAPFTYLIYNNQDYIKTHRVVNYRKGKWTCLAYTWQDDSTSYVKFYVDSYGIRTPKPLVERYKPKGKLYIGSDIGAPRSKKRWANFDIDEFLVFTKALNGDEILAIYNNFIYRDYSGVPNPPMNQEIVSVKPGGESDKSQPRDSERVVPRIRSVFDEGTGWATKAGANMTVKRISEAGFNVYIPCVWHGKGTRYFSKKAPLEQGIKKTSPDPLRYLIAVAHENNIEVHPWFTVALRQREFFREFYDTGTPENAFDLHKDEFRNFIVSLIIEVVRNYDIDGINLDYIRTMGICTSDSCIRDYRKKYGRDLLQDMKHRNDLGNLETHLQEWLDRSVEEIVRNVAMQAKKIKPGLIISVDGQALPTEKVLNRQGRHEIRWANKGYVDIIYHMAYGDWPDFDRMLMAQGQLTEREKLVPLLANYRFDAKSKKVLPRRIDLVKSAVDKSISLFPHGLGIYWYYSLSNEQVRMLRNGPFNNASQRIQ
ncbi:MAG: family 10 glycosylhydrolase [Nitrospinales bacterium]